MEKSLDQVLWEFDAAFKEMREEEARMTAVDEAVQKGMKKAVLATYPGFAEWDADLMRKVDEAVWRASRNFVGALEDVYAEMSRRAGGGD